MAKLTKHQKMWLVQCLAEFHTPTEAARAFFNEFGVVVEPKQAERYDPNKVAGLGLARELKALFVKHRKAYLKDTKAHIPIANKTVRLRALSEELKKFQRNGNSLGVLRVLEQAAKEMGGSYTNLKQLTGKDGGAIKTEQRVLHELPQEQITAELRALGYDPDPDAPEVPTIQ